MNNIKNTYTIGKINQQKRGPSVKRGSGNIWSGYDSLPHTWYQSKSKSVTVCTVKPVLRGHLYDK
jgi:hypothetical protein